MTPWWHEPLSAWAEIAEAPIVIERYTEPPAARRQLGDWWRRGREWCVHLDDGHYARVEQADLDRRLRQALSWTLQTLARTTSHGWRQQVTEWWTELLALPDDQVILRLAGHRAGRCTAHTPADSPGPGRFVVLHVVQGGGDSPADIDELAAAVHQVALAQHSHFWLAWVSRDPRSGAALLYWPAGETDGGGGPGGLRERVLDLVQTVTAEAFVACSAFAGAPVRDARELYAGLATAVVTWRSKTWTERGKKVIFWGDDPVAHLLQAIPAPSAHVFLDLVRARAPSADLTLAPELAEALSGIIAANLNVSEAARLLYLHRNTLMNRIERIRVQTGYDVRNFGDALVLWLATSLSGHLTGAHQPPTRVWEEPAHGRD